MSERARGGLVDADAAMVLRRPLAMVLVLAFVAGAIDAADYRAFGVFTANQAGNMVLLWVELPDRPSVALLCLSSLIGCALGVALVVVLRSLERLFDGASGSRLLLYVAGLILGVAALVGITLFDPPADASTQGLVLWSPAWWAAVVSVSASAFSLGVLATVFVSVGEHRLNIVASTGPFVDASRYLAASIRYRVPEFGVKWRRLIALPVAWSLGALVVGLVRLDRGLTALLGVLLVVAIAVSARPSGSGTTAVQ